MALKITTREVDGVTVAALDGRIVLGEESNALREKVKSLVAEGKKKVARQGRAALFKSCELIRGECCHFAVFHRPGACRPGTAIEKRLLSQH